MWLACCWPEDRFSFSLGVNTMDILVLRWIYKGDSLYMPAMVQITPHGIDHVIKYARFDCHAGSYSATVYALLSSGI